MKPRCLESRCLRHTCNGVALLNLRIRGLGFECSLFAFGAQLFHRCACSPRLTKRHSGIRWKKGLEQQVRFLLFRVNHSIIGWVQRDLWKLLTYFGRVCVWWLRIWRDHHQQWFSYYIIDIQGEKINREKCITFTEWCRKPNKKFENEVLYI